jgi:hypothetical protein
VDCSKRQNARRTPARNAHEPVLDRLVGVMKFCCCRLCGCRRFFLLLLLSLITKISKVLSWRILTYLPTSFKRNDEATYFLQDHHHHPNGHAAGRSDRISSFSAAPGIGLLGQILPNDLHCLYSGTVFLLSPEHIG